jgi:hypothetical protein
MGTKEFKTTVAGVGPFCVEYADGEIVTMRHEELQHLLAAAPAMYEALHRAVTEMEFWSKGHSDAEIAIAHAALAQAEGAVVRMVPHSTSDVCWCQPFDGPKHPNCPMHGKPKAILAVTGAISHQQHSGTQPHKEQKK